MYGEGVSVRGERARPEDAGLTTRRAWRMPQHAHMAAELTLAISPRDRSLAGWLAFSLLLHAGAAGALRTVHFELDRPPLLVDLVARAPSGSPGSGPVPDRTPPSPAPMAHARAATAARTPAPAAPRVDPPPQVASAPRAPETVSPPSPAPREPEPQLAPAAAPSTERPEWPSVKVPPVGLPRFGALARAGPGESSGALPGPVGAVTGSFSSGSSALSTPNLASRAWGGKSGTDAGGGGVASLLAPRLAHEIRPRYPESARRAGIEGTTLVKARVLADGSVGVAEVRRSSGYPELDRAALEAIRESHFIAAERGGARVTVWIEIPVKFSLEQ